MNQKLGRPPGYKERRAARTPVNAKARLTQQGWYNVEVSLCDLSSSGFMALCDENVRIGSFVSLDVPGIGEVQAQVRWQMVGRMGGMFTDPINLHRCEWVAVKREAPDKAA